MSRFAVPRLKLSGLSKSYGGVQALDDVSLEVRPGEVHGLVGENGAGKSTLIKIVSGAVTADVGDIYLDGHRLQVRHPRDARDAGIVVVHQEAELFPHLSLAENMLLGQGLPRNCWGLIDWTKSYAQAEEALQRVGESFPVRPSAGNMSVARRMLAEIAAAVDQQARLLFLDEPSAALTKLETDRLFQQIREMVSQGVAIVYVSHRLEEIQRLCDRVTVLRDGKHVWTEEVASLSSTQIVTHMVGRELSHVFPEKLASRGPGVLRLENMTDAAGRFHDVSLSVHRGEILGIYGLVGAGRTELAEAIFGLRPLVAGRVYLNEKQIAKIQPTSMMQGGVVYLPEDRLVHGVFAQLSLTLNTMIAVLRTWYHRTFVNRQRSDHATRNLFDKLRVKYQSVTQPIHSLSGGNQQKVLFARWLLTEPDVLIVDEPTRGIDVEAKMELHRLLAELSAAGQAVLMISSDLPEAMGMSDRLLVMCEGRIAAEFVPVETREEEIVQAALPQAALPQGTTARESSHSHAKAVTVQWLRELSLLIALALLASVLALVEPGKFASINNFQDIAASAAIPFLMALGATLVIASGGIDISVGSILALSAAVCGLAVNYQYSIVCAVSWAVVTGAMLGTVNGLLAIVGRIHPIIVTLATLGVYRGLMRVITAEKRIEGFPDQFRLLTEGYWYGVRPLIWYSLVAVVAGTVFLQWTRTGRSLLAVGDSPRAADMIGLSRTRLQLVAFTACGALTGLAGVLWAASYGIVDTYTAQGWELKAVAAAVVGGCLITGGTGTAWGAAIGALLMELIRNGLVILGVSVYWEGFFVGILILIVVFVDQRLRGTVV